jgi:hypothetical protein
MVVALLAFALGMVADASITLLAVHQIRKSQTEILSKASSDFERKIGEIAERVVGDAVVKTVSSVPGLVRSFQEGQVKK